MNKVIARRLSDLERAAAPASSVRVYRLPGDLSAGDASAWVAEHHPEAQSADLVVLIRTLGRTSIHDTRHRDRRGLSGAMIREEVE